MFTFICGLLLATEHFLHSWNFSSFFLLHKHFIFQGKLTNDYHYNNLLCHSSLTSSFRLSHRPHGLSSKISLSSSESSPLSLGDLCSASLLLDRLPGMAKFCETVFIVFLFVNPSTYFPHTLQYPSCCFSYFCNYFFIPSDSFFDPQLKLIFYIYNFVTALLVSRPDLIKTSFFLILLHFCCNFYKSIQVEYVKFLLSLWKRKDTTQTCRTYRSKFRLMWILFGNNTFQPNTKQNCRFFLFPWNFCKKETERI